jgi:hypothetical protein
LDVYLLDLAATLRESERSAETIERHLASVGPSSLDASATPTRDDLARVLSVSGGLLDESHRLVENVRAGRELLRQLQSECRKLRRGY